MRAIAAVFVIAACSHDDDPRPQPTPAPIDAAVRAPARAPLPRGAWRTPLLAITKETVELDWRLPSGPNEVVVTQPLASWRCPPILDALVVEAKHAWGATSVRPAASELLLVSVEPKVPDAIVLAILDCVNDRSAPRPPYKDVMISPESPR